MSAPGDHRRGRRERVALAGDAEQPDRVDEAARAGARRARGVRRASSARRASRSRRRRRRRRPPTPPTSSSGRSGRIAALTPERDQRAGEALPAEPVDEVHVGHHRERHTDVDPGQLVEDRRRRRAGDSASSEDSWMTGPSITGSENGMPTSMPSAPACATASTMWVQPASPPVRYGTRHLPPAAAARDRARPGGSQVVPEDLHHLPHVLVAPARQVDHHVARRRATPAARDTQAIAWADSSAGMMPSVRDSSWNASITSASVTGS